MTRRQGILRCPACGLWRPWHSFQERPNIDRECIKCGNRIRVQLDRDPRGKRSWLHSQGRGRPRKVEVKELPEHMPHRAVVKMTRAHNRHARRSGRIRWQVKGGTEGFTRASEIDPGMTPGKIDQESFDSILDSTEREVGESDENEV